MKSGKERSGLRGHAASSIWKPGPAPFTTWMALPMTNSTLKVKKLEKTGDKTYVAHSGFMTACEEARPKWSFTVSKTQINLDSTARLKHTLFRVKNVPVFYFPYIILPTEKKDRSSGFLLPSIGNSNKKGRSFSQSFYLVLGRSADATVRRRLFLPAWLRLRF